MIGLLYIGFFGVYLLLSGWLTDWAARKAKARGIAGWKWGLPMALMMYHLVFWDWVPIEIMYRYNCSNHAGFTQYKTLAEWKAENPGVAETLQPIKGPQLVREDSRDRYVLNQRFVWDIERTTYWFHIWKREERIVDLKTGEVLARYVDFSTKIQGFGVSYNKSLSDYKVWLSKRSCEQGDARRTKPIRFKFSKFMYLAQHQREYEE